MKHNIKCIDCSYNGDSWEFAICPYPTCKTEYEYHVCFSCVPSHYDWHFLRGEKPSNFLANWVDQHIEEAQRRKVKHETTKE